MDVRNFDSVRVGSNFPHVFDIEPIGSHEGYGVLASAFTFMGDKDDGYLQLRKHNEHPSVALFTFGSAGQCVPKFWVDSTVLWDSRSKEPNAR